MTEATYAHRLNRAVATLIERAEHPDARDPDGFPRAVRCLRDVLRERPGIPWDSTRFPDLWEAECWLHNLLDGPSATPEQVGLTGPDHILALRAILGLIPDPL